MFPEPEIAGLAPFITKQLTDQVSKVTSFIFLCLTKANKKTKVLVLVLLVSIGTISTTMLRY